MKPLTETQICILEQLHIFRFLTVKQIHTLEVVKNIVTVRRAIKPLSDGKRALVGFVDFGTFPTIGRLSRIYYLSKYGATLLAEALQCPTDEINHPKGVKLFSRDYFHRIATLDLHIIARKFCKIHSGLEFDFFHAYYEHTGANHWGDPTKQHLQSNTTIKIDENTAFIPDCIFKITDPRGKPWLFVGEIYRGHTTKRVHQQLDKYLKALEKGSINNLYDFKRPISVLVVCETEGSMLSLMKRLKNDVDFQNVEKYFLFRVIQAIEPRKDNKKQTTNDLIAGFVDGWKTYAGRKMSLFMG